MTSNRPDTMGLKMTWKSLIMVQGVEVSQMFKGK